jgi:site-specific recombinase XerD
LPVTFDRLCSIICTLSQVCYNQFETALFRAAYTLAFYAFLRISEIVGGGNSNRLGLQRQDIQLSSGLSVFISGSKTDQANMGATLYITPVAAAAQYCPVHAMSLYLKLRPQQPGPLFIHEDGRKLSRQQFQAVLTKVATVLAWDTKRYTTHSFRIGAATTAAINGMSQEFIQKKGRWASLAVKSYIRP